LLEVQTLLRQQRTQSAVFEAGNHHRVALDLCAELREASGLSPMVVLNRRDSRLRSDQGLETSALLRAPLVFITQTAQLSAQSFKMFTLELQAVERDLLTRNLTV